MTPQGQKPMGSQPAVLKSTKVIRKSNTEKERMRNRFLQVLQAILADGPMKITASVPINLKLKDVNEKLESKRSLIHASIDKRLRRGQIPSEL